MDPITVRAHFGDGWTHGHLAGLVAGDWPMQVTSGEDAERQEMIIWTIAETELHQIIWASYHPLGERFRCNSATNRAVQECVRHGFFAVLRGVSQ